MTERTSYLAGTPSWVDLGSPDTAAAATFYGELFGWEAGDLGPDAGGYGMYSLRGKRVAGFGPQGNPDVPPFWAVYVTVTDADATAAAATAAGGTAVAGPMDVFDAGRMVVLQDPNGTFISAWQPRATIGAELVNEPGAFIWNELSSADLAAARQFYVDTFGWGLGDQDGDDAAHFTVAGEVVCGGHTAGPDEFPAWSVWFAVEDCDASAATATSLGGTVLMPPNDMGFGRGAMIADPQGAVFGICSVDATSAP